MSPLNVGYLNLDSVCSTLVCPGLLLPLPPARLCELAVPISALSAQDEPPFWQTVIVCIAVLVIYAPLLAGYTYLRDRFLVSSPAILHRLREERLLYP